jgi:hypothetical protein
VPISYEIDRDHKLIRTRCVGSTTFAEVLDHFQALGAEPALPEPLNVLLDLSELTAAPESHQVRAIADEVRAFRTKLSWGAIAIVAISDLNFGMSRMLAILAEDHFANTGVFRRLAEAEDWLRSQRAASRPAGDRA